MLSFLWDLASFIVALGVLITVHEFGHFWVARRCGVRVERFSIGFGKALWRRTDKLGTEYVIALIPLGGYVKMLDERAATGNRISRARYVGGATEFLKWWPNYGYTRRTVFGICALLKPVTFGKRVGSS